MSQSCGESIELVLAQNRLLPKFHLLMPILCLLVWILWLFFFICSEYFSSLESWFSGGSLSTAAYKSHLSLAGVWKFRLYSVSNMCLPGANVKGWTFVEVPGYYGSCSTVGLVSYLLEGMISCTGVFSAILWWQTI